MRKHILVAMLILSIGSNVALYKSTTDLKSVISTKNTEITSITEQLENTNKELSKTNEDLQNVLLDLSNSKTRINELEQKNVELEKTHVVVSRGGTYNYVRSMNIETTAYTHTGNPTASGVMPKRGMVAVDPSIIPMGTKMYIEGYGYAVAEDTGGLIQGNILDLFMDTEQECVEWGRKTVKIYIIKE